MYANIHNGKCVLQVYVTKCTNLRQTAEKNSDPKADEGLPGSGDAQRRYIK